MERVDACCESIVLMADGGEEVFSFLSFKEMCLLQANLQSTYPLHINNILSLLD